MAVVLVIVQITYIRRVHVITLMQRVVVHSCSTAEIAIANSVVRQDPMFHGFQSLYGVMRMTFNHSSAL